MTSQHGLTSNSGESVRRDAERVDRYAGISVTSQKLAKLPRTPFGGSEAPKVTSGSPTIRKSRQHSLLQRV